MKWKTKTKTHEKPLAIVISQRFLWASSAHKFSRGLNNKRYSVKATRIVSSLNSQRRSRCSSDYFSWHSAKAWSNRKLCRLGALVKLDGHQLFKLLLRKQLLLQSADDIETARPQLAIMRRLGLPAIRLRMSCCARSDMQISRMSDCCLKLRWFTAGIIRSTKSGPSLAASFFRSTSKLSWPSQYGANVIHKAQPAELTEKE